MYEFKSYYEFAPSDNVKDNLYNAIKNEVVHDFQDAYLRKLDTISHTYNEFSSNLVAKQANVLSRVASYMSDIKVGTISQYVMYFNKNFNKSIFSQSYITETQNTMRCLTKIDTLINHLIVTIIVTATDKETDPYLLITNYFEKQDKKIYDSFESFLADCEKVVNGVI